jgi:hypothetical protein
MKICIEQTEGGFSVYDEAANTQNSEGDVIGAETPAQTAKTVDEALAMAKQMLTGGTTQNSPEAMFAQPQADQAMQAGFQKARGPAAGY